ncbi:MAG TPA: hypothetical protein VF268_10765 [Gammaproteobacteria bacterium]
MKTLTIALLSALLALSCARNPDEAQSRSEAENKTSFVYAGEPPPAKLPPLDELETLSQYDSLTEESNAYKTRVAEQIFGDAEYMIECAMMSKPSDGAFKMYFKVEKDGMLSVFASEPDLPVTRCIGRHVVGRKVEAPTEETYVFDLNMKF